MERREWFFRGIIPFLDFLNNPGIVLVYMSVENKSSQKSATADGRVDIITTLLSTNLRIFVPTVFGPIIGWAADKLLGTRPQFILIGLGLGIVLAALLVYRQYINVIKEK